MDAFFNYDAFAKYLNLKSYYFEWFCEYFELNLVYESHILDYKWKNSPIWIFGALLVMDAIWKNSPEEFFIASTKSFYFNVYW